MHMLQSRKSCSRRPGQRRCGRARANARQKSAHLRKEPLRLLQIRPCITWLLAALLDLRHDGEGCRIRRYGRQDRGEGGEGGLNGTPKRGGDDLGCCRVEAVEEHGVGAGYAQGLQLTLLREGNPWVQRAEQVWSGPK